MKSIILDLHNQLINKKNDIPNIINVCHNNYSKTLNNNSVITPLYEQALITAKQFQNEIVNHENDLLFGIPYSLKDNVSTSNIITTGGSKFLKNYQPPYDATLYKLLKQAGAILVNKANMDEFGMGGTGLTSAYGPVHNTCDYQRITGGSSSGGVNQVADGSTIFTISSDTGDSIRRPASFVGVVGYKPTYGLISRYGVFPYAPSLDCVGINTKTVIDCAIVAQHVVTFDNQDFTSQHVSDHNFYKNLRQLPNIKINVIKDIETYLDKEVVGEYQRALVILRKSGHVIKEVNIPIEVMRVIAPTYMATSYAESSSCYANLTGINFGLNEGGSTYEQLILNNRSKGIGKEVIRRLVIGQLLTNKENFKEVFLHAKRVRTLLIKTYNTLLKNADCFLLPGASSVAPLIESINNKTFQTTYADDLLVLANFAGAPSITIPYSKINHLPFGLTINCAVFDDQKALNIAYSLENLFEGTKHE
jgi:aspartyl-tRNA(Asn)/glutamyl-tRNA(Gln) amidotransferase subunit A